MISSCPKCSYSLEGLPTVHACPECGFECDQESRVFTRPRAGSKWWTAIFGVFAAIGIGVWLGTGIPTPFLFAGIPFAAGLIRLQRRQAFALVGRTGVRFVAADGSEERYAPHAIVAARWSRVTGAVVLTGAADKTLKRVPGEFFGSHMLAQSFASAVNEVCAAGRAGPAS